jgi:hypothetical protein
MDNVVELVIQALQVVPLAPLAKKPMLTILNVCNG